MDRTRFYIYMGLATVFVAVFTLFFIFDNIEAMAAKCQSNPDHSPVCGQMTGFSLTMIVVLLIIGGLVITVSATAYILFSAP
jgi:uncharacterized membrane protein YhaH (DUF805 family)